MYLIGNRRLASWKAKCVNLFKDDTRLSPIETLRFNVGPLPNLIIYTDAF